MALLTIAVSTVCSPEVADLERAIYRMGKAWPWQRHQIAKRLAPYVAQEAQRRKLDPIAMLAVASAESDFRPWVKGPGGEIGLWQLTYRDSPVDAAARTLKKEHPGLHAGRPRWLKGRPFSKRELRYALDLGTYVVAREIAYHVAYCKRHHPVDRYGRWHGARFATYRLKWWAKHWQIGVGLLRKLVRWSHYNVGPRPPLWYYLKRLVRRYKQAYYWACTRKVI